MITSSPIKTSVPSRGGFNVFEQTAAFNKIFVKREEKSFFSFQLLKKPWLLSPVKSGFIHPLIYLTNFILGFSRSCWSFPRQISPSHWGGKRLPRLPPKNWPTLCLIRLPHLGSRCVGLLHDVWHVQQLLRVRWRGQGKRTTFFLVGVYKHLNRGEKFKITCLKDYLISCVLKTPYFRLIFISLYD